MAGVSAPKSMASLDKAFQKAYGQGVGGKGYEPAQIARCPTGVFQYDLASGGGYPKNKLSIDYGPESSGKTLKFMKAVIFMQLWKPELNNVLFDIEGTYDPAWFKKLGGDPTRLTVYRPDFAEQCADMIEAMLMAPDCGLVGVDSVAAFMTKMELEKSAENDLPGILARVMSKLVGRAVWSLIQADKNGSWGTLVLINQTRMKIGVMYGDPESYPGGNKQRFASSLSTRMYGKDIVAPKGTMPHAKHHSAIIKKWKCPILAKTVTWETYTRPFDGKPVGYTGGWHDAEKLLREIGLLVNDKTGWTYKGPQGDATLKTLKEWEAHFDANPMLRVDMVNAILAKMDLEMSEGEELDEDYDKVDPETGEVLEG